MRHLAALALAGALTVWAPRARANEPTTATFALVIGSNASVDRDLAPLKYADDDAARYFDLFRLLGARTTVLSRLDDNTRRIHPQAAAEAKEPKKAELDAAWAALEGDVRQASQRGLETTVYVVFAGHGNVKNGRGYITLEDARITGADLAGAFARLPATRIHLVVDACASYFLAYGRGPGGKRRALESFAQAPELASDGRVGLLLSTSSARESHEWEAFQAGVFSHEVRSGLYGAADADGDGVVSYREIAAFVARANVAVPNERFRPDVHARPPRGGGDLLDLREARTRRIEIDGRHAAHYFLEDARGVRVLDVHNAPGQALTVVKPPPGSALFLRRVLDDRELSIPASEDVVAIASLEPRDPRIASRGAAHESFRTLFAQPFDQRSVLEWRDAPPPPPPPDADGGDVGARPPRLATRQIVGLGVAGAGAALVAAGITFSLSASSARSELATGASQADALAANDRIAQRNSLAAVGYVAGGVALATGAALFFWPDPSTRTRVAVQPVGGGALLGAAGRF